MTWKPTVNQISQKESQKFISINKSKVKYQRLLHMESMKCPSAKKRGSVEMQCNLIQAYIIPVLLMIKK